ncbi:MAG: anaerobic magnesium-protoporphyrin monomethyl ester cyclase [Archaeoglobi archaeon]|nr:anaerobic magnesium-protoporphyrin monomethyl ester cyclase [Archaeoglobi archaeon]
MKIELNGVGVSQGEMIVLLNPDSKVEVVHRLGISTPPLGIGYIASFLRENGFPVRIIDNMVEKLTLEEILERTEGSSIVGISVTTPAFKKALYYARELKKRFQDILIIFGGPHPSFMPHEVLREGCVDAVCIGEGEYTMLEVAERVERGESLENVRGLVYREGDRIVENERREFIEDLDSLPFPAFDLMPLEKYSIFGDKLDHFPMITSRGCPFGCRYCVSSALFGRKFRARSAGNVVDEMEWLVNEFQAKRIAFSDDTFTLDKRRVEEICEEICRRGLDVEWTCTSRVDTVSRELLRKMKKAGCAHIYYGVESASERVLDYYRKGIKLDEVRKAVEMTKDEGISVTCSFIIGAPFETREEMRKTLRFSVELNPDYAQFSLLTPYPGTEIYEEAKEKGLLLTENYDEFTAVNPVLKNENLSPEDLFGMLKECYLKFYLRPKLIIEKLRRGDIGILMKMFRNVRRSFRGSETHFSALRKFLCSPALLALAQLFSKVSGAP